MAAAEDPTLHARTGGTRRVDAAPPLSHKPEDLFGKFVRTDKLGAGGGGEVWKAWDTGLQRWVALKLLRTGTDADPEELQRFTREAQTAGALSHPHIAAIYEVGESAGRPYIAMQFVEGLTLRAIQPLDTRRAVRLIRDAALAIDYAHQLGIVHRDLKPENLMAVGDHVYVMDFGLARAVHNAPSRLTVSGTILGTPAYMSPEQARGRVAEIGVRSDVWSLGATLYDLLTGHPPFQGPTAWDVVLKVTQHDPEPPAGIDRDLRTIVMKCLEKDPAGRYQSARALADDLGRWLDGQPILAHPPSVVYRARKFVARHKAIAIAVLVLLAALLPVVIFARSGQGRAERALQLWTQVTGCITTASENRRAGNVDGFHKVLDHGVALCREHIARDDHPHAHYFLGRLLRLAGRLDEAEAALTRALELDPAFAESRFERGLVRATRYLMDVSTLGVRPVLEAQYGTTEGPNVEETHPRLAEQRRAAEADLSVSVGTGPFLRETDALFGRSLLAHARRELEEAVRLLNSILERDPRHSAALLQLAEIAFERNDFAESLRRATEAVAVDRGLTEASRRQALAIIGGAMSDKWLLGLEAIDRFIAFAKPPVANDYVVRGLILRRLGRDDEALQALSRAIELQPKNPYALVSRAQIRMSAKDHEGAGRDIEEALRIAPRYGSALLARANLRARTGALREALQDYEAAAAILPRLPVIPLEMAGIRRHLREFEAALADVNRALALAPENAAALGLRALLNRDLRRIDAALVDAELALRVQPDTPDALRARGWSRAEKGDVDGALKDFERLVEVDAGQPEGWSGRAMCRYFKRDYENALLDIAQAERLGDRNAELRFVRGMIHKRAERWPAALEAFDEAARMEPAHERAIAQRGIAREALGDPAGARRDYDASLKLEPRQYEILTRRAELRVDEGDVPGAIEDLEAALRHAPKSWAPRANVEALLKKLRE